MIRKTKIIATIGPATSERKVLKKIIEKGVNVCRLNFSHITHEKAKEIISTIKSINQELNVHTANEKAYELIKNGKRAIDARL